MNVIICIRQRKIANEHLSPNKIDVGWFIDYYRNSKNLVPHQLLSARLSLVRITPFMENDKHIWRQPNFNIVKKFIYQSNYKVIIFT
jgi:hypothetical protein